MESQASVADPLTENSTSVVPRREPLTLAPIVTPVPNSVSYSDSVVVGLKGSVKGTAVDVAGDCACKCKRKRCIING